MPRTGEMGIDHMQYHIISSYVRYKTNKILSLLCAPNGELFLICGLLWEIISSRSLDGFKIILYCVILSQEYLSVVEAGENAS